MSREKIESTDWLTRGIPKEQLEREKQEALLEFEMAEMLEIIEKAREIYANDITDHTENEYIREGLLDAGYRKQSEGEWKLEHEFYGRMVCSNCREEALVNDFNEYVDSEFCPNCGAKMKGGAE